MSTGHVDQPAWIRGAFEPLRTNYYCGSCRSFVQAPLGASAMRACPTPGCTRATGFGVYATVPRREPPFAFRPPEGFARRRGPVLTAWVARGVAGGNFLSPFLSGQGLIRDIGA